MPPRQITAAHEFRQQRSTLRRPCSGALFTYAHASVIARRATVQIESQTLSPVTFESRAMMARWRFACLPAHSAFAPISSRPTCTNGARTGTTRTITVDRRSEILRDRITACGEPLAVDRGGTPTPCAASRCAASSIRPSAITIRDSAWREVYEQILDLDTRVT